MKVLIVSDSLKTGGIQKALINLLNNYDFGDSKVDLFLFNDSNFSLLGINKNVNLLQSNFLLHITNYTAREALDKGCFTYLLRKFLALFCMIAGSQYLYKLLFLTMPVKSDYDIAISFTNNVSSKSVYFGSNMFVLDRVVAKIKISWLHIHPRFGRIFNNYNYNEYLRFDRIVCVSNAVKKSFTENWPSLKNKVYVVYNFSDPNYLNTWADSEKPNISEKFNIVTVARLDENKNPLAIINVAKILKDRKVDFVWYIIGSGPLMYLLKKQIEFFNLCGIVIILGELKNPYSYIKSAQLFVSFSKSESYGLAIAESLILKTPVLANYYEAIPEIIDNGVNGIYLDYSEVEFAIIIKKLIDNKGYYSFLKSNTCLILNNQIANDQLKEVMRYE